MVPALWRLLQTTDSLFPTGAFSHSGGLEGLANEGILKTADDAERAVEEILLHSFARVDLPASGLAHRASQNGDLASIVAIDGRLDALKAPREAREASRSLGRRRLRLVASLEGYRKLVEDDRTPGHQAVVTGMQAALEGIPREEAMLAFAYGTAAGLVSSAMKLLPLGQTRAQQLLSRLGEAMPGVVRSADGMPLDDLGGFLPLLDIAAMRHERGAPRLFIS
ncbi:MAG TPA: urease accessory UreF family protein [Planctomycetota bacterium]|jgi:urease accessory protein|nr:urease accessory UreF family protein [Planctomycetota bacterium]